MIDLGNLIEKLTGPESSLPYIVRKKQELTRTENFVWEDWIWLLSRVRQRYGQIWATKDIKKTPTRRQASLGPMFRFRFIIYWMFFYLKLYACVPLFKDKDINYKKCQVKSLWGMSVPSKTWINTASSWVVQSAKILMSSLFFTSACYNFPWF